MLVNSRSISRFYPSTPAFIRQLPLPLPLLLPLLSGPAILKRETILGPCCVLFVYWPSEFALLNCNNYYKCPKISLLNFSLVFCSMISSNLTLNMTPFVILLGCTNSMLIEDMHVNYIHSDAVLFLKKK